MALYREEDAACVARAVATARYSCRCVLIEWGGIG